LLFASHKPTGAISLYRWPRAKTVALDCEASGIDPTRDIIWQYGVYGVEADGVTEIDVHGVVRNDAVTTGRNPRTIPGIPAAEWAAARPLPDHLDRLHAALDGAALWCHKRAFDWELVKREFRRHGRRPPRPLVVHCSELLTRHRLAMPASNQSCQLQDLCTTFGVCLTTWHNARADARATFELVVRLANVYWYDWFEERDAARWAARSRFWPPPPPFGWATRLWRQAAPPPRHRTSALARFRRERAD